MTISTHWTTINTRPATAGPRRSLARGKTVVPSPWQAARCSSCNFAGITGSGSYSTLRSPSFDVVELVVDLNPYLWLDGVPPATRDELVVALTASLLGVVG